MICNVIGLGPSGQYWNGVGYSIGVNDCLKWGHEVDILIIVNSLKKYPERRKIAEASNPRVSLLGIGSWSNHPKYQAIPYMTHWKGKLDKGKIYRTSTSTFIAATLAYSLGYDKIVLWGVDFYLHPIIKGQTLRQEIEAYASLQKALLKNGASMYIGQVEGFENTGALADVLPKWTRIEQTVF